MVKRLKIIISSKCRVSEESGFTVMELVVATGIFALLIILTFGIFSFGLQGQRRALLQSRIDREAQLIMEALAKKIRSSTVDYQHSSYSGGINNPVNNLALRDGTNTLYEFTLDISNQAIDLAVENGAPLAISSDLVQVTDIDFFIEPTSDPFLPGLPPATQPRVTIVITMTATLAGQQTNTIIEQTVPQRGGAY